VDDKDEQEDVECRDSFDFESAPKLLIGDALRRKSTGSYDATTVSKTIAAAMKPGRHRRSVSQNELDAMMTVNDDCHLPIPTEGKQLANQMISEMYFISLISFRTFRACWSWSRVF